MTRKGILTAFFATALCLVRPGPIRAVCNACASDVVCNGCVTNTDIADGTITGADVSSSAALSVGSMTTSGSVGVGTAPGFKLDVLSTAGSIPLRLKSLASDTGTLLFQMGSQANSENAIVSLTSNEQQSKNLSLAGYSLGNIGHLKLAADQTFITGNTGMGVDPPGSRLHIMNALNNVGTIFALPPIASLPDPSYTHRAVMQWEGGEAKFGKWRQSFNTFENDWALSYNTPYDPVTNTYGGRDSGDSRANIAAVMRFNVAEGDSGGNVFEVHFAPPAAAGVPPDFNGAASYVFFDGKRGDAVTSRPALLAIGGPQDVDTGVQLLNAFMGVRMMIDGVTPYSNRFRIRDVYNGADYMTIQTPNGNVGIGTSAPGYRLQVGNPGDGTQARANAWNLFSSREYKTDIRRVDEKESRGILEKVKALDVVRYRFRNDAEKTEHLGVIAEEAPKEISKDGSSVSMGDYVAFLMAALKAQQAKIEELEGRVQKLAQANVGS